MVVHDVHAPDSARARIRSPLRRAAITFIETYRSDVSAGLGSTCRFERSCSQYGLDAFTEHTFPVATAMTVVRLSRCRTPASSRRLRRAVGALAVVVAAVVALPLMMSSALAQVTAGCTASLNGVDANRASTPDRAIEVEFDSLAPASGTMVSGPIVYKVELEVAGVRWTASDGTSSGNAWSSTVDIKKYAKYGVGLYKVHVVSTNAAGQRCTADGYVKVVGKGALSTVAGLAGGAALVGGLAMTGVATLRAAKPVDADYDVSGSPSPGFGATPSDEEPYAVGAEFVARHAEEENLKAADARTGRKPDAWEKNDRAAKLKLCSVLLFPGLLLTVRAMLANRGRRG